MALGTSALGQDDPPWTNKAKDIVKVRIAQAVDDAKLLLSTGAHTVPGRPSSTKAAEGKLSALCDRHQLMETYVQLFGGPER